MYRENVKKYADNVLNDIFLSTINANDDPGKKFVPPAFKSNETLLPSNCDEISSSLR